MLIFLNKKGALFRKPLSVFDINMFRFFGSRLRMTLSMHMLARSKQYEDEFLKTQGSIQRVCDPSEKTQTM
jgi:hypothetical protein